MNLHLPCQHENRPTIYLNPKVTEPRALRRRAAQGVLQRVYRGHLGRKTFRRQWVLLTTAAVFLQRAYRVFTMRRRERLFRRRHEAAVLIQRAWYRLHGIIFSQLVLGIVKNKKDAVVNKHLWVSSTKKQACNFSIDRLRCFFLLVFMTGWPSSLLILISGICSLSCCTTFIQPLNESRSRSTTRHCGCKSC